MRIKIESAEIISENRVDQKGQPYESRKQRASIDNGTTYPLEFLIPVPKGAGAYPSGEYEAVSPFSSDQYGNLSLSRYMKLRAVAANKPAARAVG